MRERSFLCAGVSVDGLLSELTLKIIVRIGLMCYYLYTTSTPTGYETQLKPGYQTQVGLPSPNPAIMIDYQTLL